MYVCPERRKKKHHHWPMKKEVFMGGTDAWNSFSLEDMLHIQGPRTHPTWKGSGCKMMVHTVVNLSDKHEWI